MDEIKTTIRVPEPLLERVRAAATHDHRSVNGEILWLVELALDERERNAQWLTSTD